MLADAYIFFSPRRCLYAAVVVLVNPEVGFDALTTNIASGCSGTMVGTFLNWIVRACRSGIT